MNAPNTNPNVFDPPSADRLAQHLAEYSATPSRPMMRGWVLIAVAAGMLLLAPLFALVPALGVLLLLVPLAVFWLLAGKAHRARALQERVVRVWELAMLRQHREALRRAWTLLQDVRPHPELHLRCVAVLAHTLDDLAQYDAAIVAFDHMLDRLPTKHPMALQVRVQRANAALCDDRLADADDELRKLRNTVENLPPGPIPAGFHLARLVQDVRTGHFADANQHADDTAQHLQPLGIQAGYGYGLLAYCKHQLALRNDDAPAAAQQHAAATHRWHQATLLVPPAALAFRYHELRALLDHEPQPQATDA